MIDIHCHILPGIDDGAEHMEQAVAMARLAYEDGIRHIVATPHFCASYDNHREIVLRKTAELQDELDGAGIAVRIHPGNEVRLESAEYIYANAAGGRFCYLGEGKRFVLLEQPWRGDTPNNAADSAEIVDWFVRNGTIPIIPHPERHYFLRDRPEQLDQLLELGAWTQVTADSLTGRNGEEARQFAFRLLERNLVHTLATDAHNTNRKPNLTEGFRIVAATAGERRLREIRERMERIIPE